MHGYFVGLVIDLDHPVVEAAVGVTHDVVENHELLELFAEVLLQLFVPDEFTRAIRRVGGVVVFFVAVVEVVARSACVTPWPSPLL